MGSMPAAMACRSVSSNPYSKIVSAQAMSLQSANASSGCDPDETPPAVAGRFANPGP